MNKTTFEIPKMDCPSEENLIRVKLKEIDSILNLGFDLSNRKLTVIHTNHLDEIENALEELNLGSHRIGIETAAQFEFSQESGQRKLLWIVLGINFFFFLLEMITGLISNSMGLVADSLDMLADAFVYGISLLAVGAAISSQKRVAKLAGYFQLILAVLGFGEVLRRFFVIESMPDFSLMMGISFLALIGNTTSLFLLQKSKSKAAHMQASMIFTSNDVIINIGVIVAGGLVYWLQSGLPDLIIGSVVFVLVIQGALRILKLAK